MPTFNLALQLWVGRSNSNSSNFIVLANTFYTPINSRPWVTLKTIRWSIPFISFFIPLLYLHLTLWAGMSQRKGLNTSMTERIYLQIFPPSSIGFLLKSTKSIWCCDCTCYALTDFDTALFVNAALWTRYPMLLEVTCHILRSVSPA